MGCYPITRAGRAFCAILTGHDPRVAAVRDFFRASHHASPARTVMRPKFLLFLLLLLAVVVFSVQNAGMVRLRFLGWAFSASQALVIFLCALVGVAIGLVLARRWRAKPPQR